MIKTQFYGKTRRLGYDKDKFYVTEKLDGSNMAIWKQDNIIYIAQRNYIMTADEIINDNIDILNKGIKSWVTKNIKTLDKIPNGTGLCGEWLKWLGRGHIKYTKFDKLFYAFAMFDVSDIIDNKLDLSKANYYIPHINERINALGVENIIGTVPFLNLNNYSLEKEYSKVYLDCLYEEYTKESPDQVEGFVIHQEGKRRKYVRLKNGHMQEHK